MLLREALMLNTDMLKVNGLMNVGGAHTNYVYFKETINKEQPKYAQPDIAQVSCLLLSLPHVGGSLL